MYKKKFTTTTLLLLILLCGFHVVRAQTYGRCDAVDEYVYAYAAADDNMQREETFTLAVDRSVTIQYGFDSQEQAKGGATVCLYNAGGGLTVFGCESGRDGSGSTVLFLPAGSYRMVAGAASVNPNGEGNDMISGWIRVTSDKLTPLSFNVTGGGSGCDGGNATFPIGLGNSEPGVTYQLSRDNVPVATFTSGGGPFSFGNFQTPGTYTVATVSPCVIVPMLGYAVITDPRPSSFTAWNDGPKCQANPAPEVKLSATDIPGATYTWTGPYGATQTTQASHTTINGLLGRFDYSVSANINGCITSTAITSVEIFQAPQASASGPPNVCGLGTTLTGSSPGAGFTGRWEQKSGPVQTTFGDPNAGITGVTVGMPGTYVYKWIVSGASVCAPSIKEVTVTFNIDPTVRLVSIGNNGLRCSTDSPLTISLSNSQPGISYQVLINGAPTGTVLPGNGGTLVWQDLGSGAYKIKASGTGGCERVWDAGTVSVTETPALRTVSGSATVCAGTPVSVTLANPEPSVTYEVLNNGSLAGLGAPTVIGNTLSWPVQTSGNYTVRAKRGSCVQLMSGTASITITPVPKEYEVSGNGTQCADGAGFTITLGGSEMNVKYQLLIDNQPSGAVKPGTGGALTWTNQKTTGEYTVEAKHDNGGCTRLMTGSGHITINPLPTVYTIGGGGAVCAGNPFSITLSDSDIGIRYQLKRGATFIGSFKEGTGNPLSWDNQMASGSYSITATNVATGCIQSTGTIGVVFNTVPSAFNMSGGGARCDDKPGLTVSLHGSQAPLNEDSVNYQLIRDNNIAVGDPRLGTGSAIHWENIKEGGIYSVLAIHDNGCTRMIKGNPQIVINTKAAPTEADAGDDGNICGFEVELSANTAIVGNGEWKPVSWPDGGQSNFADIHSPNTSVTATAPGTYVYAWVITNENTCISADSVNVIFNATAPKAIAGPPQEICDGNVIAFMDANDDENGNGQWTVSGPGDPVFYPDDMARDAFLFTTEPGIYTCVWTIKNNPCEATSDTVLIKFGIADEPFTVTESLLGGEKQYLIAEAQTDVTWRNAHTYQWLYTNSSNVQTNVTNTATPWQTRIIMFPDFLSGSVTDATLQVDVYSYGCLSRQVFGKDISGGTLRRQEKPAMPKEISQSLDEDIQVYPVPASESLMVQIPFEGTWKAELRNMNGALIQTVTNNDRASIFDVSAIPAGLYVLYIQGNSKRVVRKVEVVR